MMTLCPGWPGTVPGAGVIFPPTPKSVPVWMTNLTSHGKCDLLQGQLQPAFSSAKTEVKKLCVSERLRTQ